MLLKEEVFNQVSKGIQLPGGLYKKKYSKQAKQ